MLEGAGRKNLEWTESADLSPYTDDGRPSDVESYDLDDSSVHGEKSASKVWNTNSSWFRRLLPPSLRKSTFSPDRNPHDRRYNAANLAIAAFSGFVLCLLFQAVMSATSDGYKSPPAQTTPSDLVSTPLVRTKPEGIKIIGLMFYGRPMFVNVLNCYLQKNMASNGGWLDEIHFIANTKHEEDLAYLDKLVEDSQGQFKRIDQTGGWEHLWSVVSTYNETDIVVKIDDDVVYLHHDAIPRLVTSVIDHPEAYAVGGNIINTPHSHFLQYHTGGLLAYLPDSTPLDPSTPPTWRASLLPRLDPSTYPDDFDWTYNSIPRHNMTRWLPLSHTSANLRKTPAVNASWPDPSGGMTMFTYAPEIESWAMAAQIHYSFLEHLENNAVERVYTRFGNPERLWDQQYERYSINFMAVRAGKISRQDFWLNDEVCITISVPLGTKEPFLIDMAAVASHYSFSSQHELLHTDVLKRYLAYANEMVCPPDRQIVPMVSSMERTGNV